MGGAMTQILILTPDPAGRDFNSRWPAVLGELASTLESAGLAVASRSWAEQDVPQADLVLPLLVWGYHRAGPRWHQAVARWQSAGVRLANPAPVLRWNADKTYLRRLADAGAPVAPALFADALSIDLLDQAAKRFGTDRLVAKPQVSASAWQTIRWSPGDLLDGGPTGAAIVQPYLPAIEQVGEFSLIYCGGRFSHAIRKRPQPGDFRVQPEYDGIITPHVPAPDELAAADAILACVEEPLLYARVDLVRDFEGKPVLMELELVEPDLYLGFDPGRGSAFAEAVKAAAEARTAPRTKRGHEPA
jgi:hypothetical protein